MLVVAAVCMLGSCSWPAADRGAIAATPKALLDAWCQAFLQRDVDAMVACYEPGESILLMHSTGQVIVGSDAIRGDYEAAFGSTIFDQVGLELGDVASEGDVTWVTGRLRMLTRPAVGDAKWQLQINTTFVMRRSQGRWRIAHEQSTPVMGVPRVKVRS